MKKELWIAFLLFTPSYSQAALQTLRDIRPNLNYPAYTDADKQLIADQALLFGKDLYVHRAMKVKAFGPQMDAVKRLETIQDVATSMTPEQLNDAISKVFLDQRDLHFNYYRPKEVACWAAWLPVSFTNVMARGRLTTVISSINTPAVADYPVLSSLAVGDRLLTYDGQVIDSALASLGQLGAGANSDAWLSRATARLSLRSLKMLPIPATDGIHVIIQHANGTKISLELPWLAKPLCTSNFDGSPATPRVKPLLDARDDDQELYNEIFAQRLTVRPSPLLVGLTDLSDTADKTVHQGIVHTSSGTFGFLKLDSFVPSLPPKEVLQVIRNILTTDFANFDGVIIDVRDNSGGSIQYAEQLPQFFNAAIMEPTASRILATPLNLQIFTQTSFRTEVLWAEAIQNAITGGKALTETVAITTLATANGLGQLWFKPVVVLTNSNCYSACDMFSASMQDNKAAIIVGDDSTTGAGGANVMEHGAFVKLFKDQNIDSPLKDLPFGQNMRVSWRQTIRSKLHRGQLLENHGVKSDVQIRRVEEDLYHNEAYLMEKVGTLLALQSPRYTARVADINKLLVMDNGSPTSWDEVTADTDSIDVLEQGVLLSQNSVSDLGVGKISLDGATYDWKSRRYELIGRKNGNRVWRIYRDVRWTGSYTALPANTPLSFDFESGLPDLFKFVQQSGERGSGWNVNAGSLMIGNGTKYEDDVSTEVYLPLATTGLSEVQVSFDLSVDTEDKYDVLSVYARIPGKSDLEKLLSVSGIVSGPQSLSLKKLVNQEKVDLVFEFQSDSSVTGKGISIDNLLIRGVSP